MEYELEKTQFIWASSLYFLNFVEISYLDTDVKKNLVFKKKTVFFSVLFGFFFS